MRSILCVDDMEDELQNLVLYFRNRYRVFKCSKGEDALPIIKQEKPALVILDIRMPGKDGFELLKEINALPSPPAVLMLSAYSDPLMVVRALQNGADDFVAKPYSSSLLCRRVEAIIKEKWKRSSAPKHHGAELPSLIGSSETMKKLRTEINAYAVSDLPVLILGESGTGKDLAARALHAASSRAGGAYVVRNIASISETLVAAELFGSKPGAYTDAVEQQGCFVLANGGTLFLDEIGDAPLAVQISMLRVLEDGQVRPLGSGKFYQTDCRLISATNQDLDWLIAKGRFREDLRYRIDGVTIDIPPLRSHAEDIPELASFFLNSHAGPELPFSPSISEESLALLMDYTWPGNIRQLRNCIVRARLLACGKTIEPEHIRFPRLIPASP
jgi:DNA-binding NtrC family response regulator